MNVENNNNTMLPGDKRSASGDVEGDAQNIKRLKRAANESVGEVHVPGDNNNKGCLQRAPAQHPKKRLQLGNKNAGSTGKEPKQNKNEAYMYGNYRHYYGKRILDEDFHDIRLDVLASHQHLFSGKQLLDIGCNSGHLSIEIAKKFNVKSLVGLDIDRNLVQIAQKAVNALKRSITLSNAQAAGMFPFNLKFLHGNYVLEDDVLLEIERPQYDVILCLSVTKWIHLNFCDAGLKQAFRRMFLQLRPGGKLILEPQSFDTYKRRKKLTDKILDNYNDISFKPNQFTDYLLSPDVGFANMELMGVPEHCKAGFKRPIQIFNKVL